MAAAGMVPVTGKMGGLGTGTIQKPVFLVRPWFPVTRRGARWGPASGAAVRIRATAGNREISLNVRLGLVHIKFNGYICIDV